VKRFLRFCAVGGAAFFVDAGLLVALTAAAGLDPYVARVISFLAAATFTWGLNRSFTFEVRRKPTGSEWAAYVALMSLGAAVNYGAYAAAITWWTLARDHLWIGVALGSIAGLGINFVTSRRLLKSS
jgi:putative flippase GtrA